MDIRKEEAAETGLQLFIDQRDRKRRETEGDRPAEDVWQRAERARNERRRTENAWAWLQYHSRQLKNHETTSAIIARHHKAEIARYERILGIHDDGPPEAA